jgi:hypothetical protein
VDINIDAPNLPSNCAGVSVKFCPLTGAVTAITGKLPTRGLPRRIFRTVQNGAGYFGFTSMQFGTGNVIIHVRNGMRGTAPEAFLQEALGFTCSIR